MGIKLVTVSSFVNPSIQHLNLVTFEYFPNSTNVFSNDNIIIQKEEEGFVFFLGIQDINPNSSKKIIKN